MLLDLCKKCKMNEMSGNEYITCNVLRGMYSRSTLIKVDSFQVECPIEKWMELYKEQKFTGDDLK